MTKLFNTETGGRGIEWTPVFYKGNSGPLFAHYDFGDEQLNRWREDFPVRYRDGSEIPAVVERQRQCAKRGWTRTSLPLV
jgi:hypothetical protein